jgi:TM2 domain-containing membrane protein YozV
VIIRLPSASAALALLRQERRSVGLTYLFWAMGLFGLNGIHRFYCRKPVSGGIWLMSLGLVGIGQMVDLFLIPGMVEEANRPLLQLGLATADTVALPSLERQLLRLARASGRNGFSLNDALIELELPAGAGSAAVRSEIDRLLLEHLLDVGNDERGRVVYREP